jgi:large subunit ribosomal protein L9
MIAEALESQGFIVDKKQLELAEPIKKLGTYEVPIRLAPEVQTTVSVVVVSDKA